MLGNLTGQSFTCVVWYFVIGWLCGCLKGHCCLFGYGGLREYVHPAAAALLTLHAPSLHPLLTPSHLYSPAAEALLPLALWTPCSSGLLVHPASSNSLTLNGESQHDGGGPELAPWGAEWDAEPAPCPLPRYLRIKHRLLPLPFCFFLPTYLPLYFGHIIVLFVLLYAFSTPFLLSREIYAYDT